MRMGAWMMSSCLRFNPVRKISPLTSIIKRPSQYIRLLLGNTSEGGGKRRRISGYRDGRQSFEVFPDLSNADLLMPGKE